MFFKAEQELKDVIPWDQPWSVGGVPDYLLPILEEQLQKRGLEERLELSDCWVFILEKHVEMPLIDIPSNYKIQQAAPNDVGFIDKLWKFQSDASLQSLRSQAELGLTFGTYVDGEIKSALVAFKWVLMTLIYFFGLWPELRKFQKCRFVAVRAFS